MVDSGKMLGKNKIVLPLGSGGFGDVYSCYNTDHTGLIAIKVCKTGLSQEDELRFIQENKILYKLHELQIHPRIILPLSEVEKNDIYIYYIMELADFNLEDYLTIHYENDLKKQIELFKKICEGLKHAHENSIVHRDLWWNNVLINKKDFNTDVKLNDFGRAKDFSLKIVNSKTTCFGHWYISPPENNFEIWDFTNNENLNNYILGDIYALGIILHYILTISSSAYSLEIQGRISGFIIRNHIDLNSLDYLEKERCYYRWVEEQKNFPFSTLNVTLNEPSLSLQINDIIQKMCNIDYKLRYSSVEELIKDLETLNI